MKFSKSKEMNLSEIREAVFFCFLSKFHSKINLMPHIVGAPGIGKSSIARSFIGNNEFMGMNFNIKHLVDFRAMLHTPDEVKGLYFPASEDSENFKNGKLENHMITNFPDKPNTLFLFEELNAADPDIQKALLEVVLDEKINDRKLPPFTYFLSVGNTKRDSIKMYDLIPPLQDRVIEMRFKPSRDDVINIVSTFSLPLAQLLLKNKSYLDTVMDDSKDDTWNITPRFLEFIAPIVNAYTTGKFNKIDIDRYIEAKGYDKTLLEDDLSTLMSSDNIILADIEIVSIEKYLKLLLHGWPSFTTDIKNVNKPITDIAKELLAGTIESSKISLALPFLLMNVDFDRYEEYNYSSKLQVIKLIYDVITTIDEQYIKNAFLYINLIGKGKASKYIVNNLSLLEKEDDKYSGFVLKLKHFISGMSIKL